MPRYLIDRNTFIAAGGKISSYNPILFDWVEQAGSTSGHYFHQDLLVAEFIYKEKPSRHIDIGSRIDGFVAHVASYRPIEIIDIRPLKDSGHKNIKFLQADLMSENDDNFEIADSVSCLHAIEHFGLGRYGDNIDPDGHIKGFNNIVKILKPNGLLYISFPISNKTEVHFNAQRVFNPEEIFTWLPDPSLLKLLRFDLIDDDGKLHLNQDIKNIGNDLYLSCGIYTFIKL